MSPGRRVFFLSLSGLSVLWALIAMDVSATRFEYRNMVARIRAGEDAPGPEALAAALDAYRASLSHAPCNATLHDDMALLIGQGTDAAILADTADSDRPLERMQDALAAQLSCRPGDGKAWLDWAVLDVYREGFTSKAQEAYRMSQRVAPGESWLAEKRLLFALQFRDLFDATGMQAARADLAVLKHAHPNRMHEVVAAAQVPDAPALGALFAATATTKSARP